jgi:limonene-1,2-epoxide hydrolase
MTATEILAFAERFVTAVERGDSAAVRACYAADARIWHNNDGVEQTVDQNMKMLEWFVRNMRERRYRIKTRAALADGFVQTHVLEATRPDGRPFRLEACVLVRMAGGVIVRLDEYIDSAQTATSATPRDVAFQIIADWRERNIDAVMARIDPAIVWHFHAGARPPIVGKEAMRAHLEAMLLRISDNRWRVFKCATDGADVLMEGVDDFVDSKGQRIPVAYMGIVTVRKGLVVEWRDYFDGGLVERLGKGEPLTEGLAPLLARPALS